MQLRSVLIAALLGIMAVEASIIPPPGSRDLVARQNRNSRQNQNERNNDNDDDDDDDDDNNNNNNNNNNGNNEANDVQCLNADAIQEGSANDGQNGNVEEGQIASLTDDANFINFCSGKTLTNGIQVEEGSCNGIPMGDIPSTNNMVSTVITNPPHNGELLANEEFDIEVQVANLQAGAFTNPQVTYYSAPQQLNRRGQIIGHTHVVIEDLGGSLDPQTPLEASSFVFFKGINDDGNGQGSLSATVDGGLPAGNYRVCTMASSSNHQPVLMPVAQRGTQEDCQKFIITNNAQANDNEEDDENNRNNRNNRNSRNNKA